MCRFDGFPQQRAEFPLDLGAAVHDEGGRGGTVCPPSQVRLSLPPCQVLAVCPVFLTLHIFNMEQSGI